ncbi:unnamed protein product [Strongylus vulgaris]|uniref:Uncharacterized protein n=1 Tax=Strongylus vulgaris TaxID=40348 RepID=A0A3P7ILY8_STRVU|nr:unnamed protein product [Strongylus vulgaris]
MMHLMDSPDLVDLLDLLESLDSLDLKETLDHLHKASHSHPVHLASPETQALTNIYSTLKVLSLAEKRRDAGVTTSSVSVVVTSSSSPLSSSLLLISVQSIYLSPLIKSRFFSLLFLNQCSLGRASFKT